MSVNDTLSTTDGKAEVLLTPGVFLRIGDNSEIRMVSPSLINTQVELTHGEAMLEVDQLVKDNHIAVLVDGGSITAEKTGLYRVTADQAPTAAVIDGKAEVVSGDKKVELGKGHETALGPVLKAQKFDSKKEDDLYAWSNVRSEYDAQASYQAAKNVYVNNYYDGLWGGWGAGWGPGWFWDGGFDSWAWLPFDGAFYSPFGWGFYSPSLVWYASVVPGHGWHGHHGMVPVDPRAPGVGTATRSVHANQVARAQLARTFAGSGFRSASGAHIAASRAGGFAGGEGFHGGGFAGGGFHGGGGGGHR